VVYSKLCFVKGQSFKETKENLSGTSLKKMPRLIAPVLKPGLTVTLCHRCKEYLKSRGMPEKAMLLDSVPLYPNKNVI
jgi:hypothetical protein